MEGIFQETRASGKLNTKQTYLSYIHFSLNEVNFMTFWMSE